MIYELTRKYTRNSLWYTSLDVACNDTKINRTPERLCGFLANVIHETGGLQSLVESMNYSSQGLMAMWPVRFPFDYAMQVGRNSNHAANQFLIAERAYGGRYGNGPDGSGDGYLFRGHGGIQTTFRSNYNALLQVLSWPHAVELLPEFLTTIPGAAESAALYWEAKRCNESMDRGDLVGVRIKINGGTNGLLEVKRLYNELSAIYASA